MNKSFLPSSDKIKHKSYIDKFGKSIEDGHKTARRKAVEGVVMNNCQPSLPPEIIMLTTTVDLEDYIFNHKIPNEEIKQESTFTPFQMALSEMENAQSIEGLKTIYKKYTSLQNQISFITALKLKKKEIITATIPGGFL